MSSPRPSRFNFWVGLVVGLLVGAGYVGLTIMAVTWKTERDDARQALLIAQAKIAAQPSNSPPPAVPPPGPLPTQAASAWPHLIKVTDDQGHVWIAFTNTAGSSVSVKACTQVTFTALATDPLQRPIAYRFVKGSGVNAVLLRDWGGPTYTWSTGFCNQAIGSIPVALEVLIQTANVQGHLIDCYQDQPCDDALLMTYVVGG